MFHHDEGLTPRTYALKSYRRRAKSNAWKYIKYFLYLFAIAGALSFALLSMNRVI